MLVFNTNRSDKAIAPIAKRGEILEATLTSQLQYITVYRVKYYKAIDIYNQFTVYNSI